MSGSNGTTAANAREVIQQGPHALIAGVTGYGMSFSGDTGGKSTTANWWFSELVRMGWRDYGIYFNPSGDGSGAPNIKADASVNSVMELAEAFGNGARLIHFKPQSTDGVSEHRALRGFVKRVYERTGLSSVVVHDEARFYAKKGALDYFVSRGSDVNCRSLVLTQHPWDVPEDIVNNLHVLVWVGPLSEQSERWFKSMGMSDQLQTVKEHTAAYHWSMFLGGTYVATMEPVPEEYL